MFFDRLGKPLTLMEWATKFETEERCILRDQIGATCISTVWIGVEQAHNSGGKPFIFETMVFGGPLNGEQYRYATEEEARAGHAEVVARALAGNSEDASGS